MNMFIAHTRAPETAARDVTPLLAHLAGPHAGALAALWPAPHLSFFELPAARRHLAAIALTRVRADELTALRGLIDRAPLRDALRFAVRPTPKGLARALGLLGEVLWAHADYDRLLTLLAEPGANLVLRHLPALRVESLERIEALPPALRQARIVARVESLEAARALADAYEAARWINPRRPPRDMVQAWSRADNAEALLRAALEALKPDRLGGLGPAPELAKPYRRITTRQRLEAEALRFRNCAAGYVWEVGSDQMAFYVREGETPALVALKRDIGGWRLAEALAADNAPLDDLDLAGIVADFIAVGVRAGQPVRMIEDRLEALADSVAAQPVVTQTYRTSLGLGQLWR